MTLSIISLVGESKQALKLKNKILLIATAIFFLTVNTRYYWEGKLGSGALYLFLLLLFVYLVLAIVLARQIYSAAKAKPTNKAQLIYIGLSTLLLALIFFRPAGFVDFEKFEGEDVLVAQREGTANCMTVLKLKDDFSFKERSVCFGITVIRGSYRIQNDTIYFENVRLGEHEGKFYKFAVIRPSKIGKEGKYFDLKRFSSLTDTIGHELRIVKNELQAPNSRE